MYLTCPHPWPRNRRQGFTLIELMIVVAVIAIVASIAVPNLLSSRLTTNESAAVATLRNLISAQAQFQAGTLIDTDEDGTGEYGFFGELSGATNLRDRNGGVNGATLTLPVLSGVFRTVRNAVVNHSGYFFQMYLPDADGVGVMEASTGGANPGNMPDADHSEITWCCYAWPANLHTSGNRAFCVNQLGILTQTNNEAAGQNYSGTESQPEPDAMFLDPSTSGSILGMIAVGTTGADGGRWVAVE